MLTSPGYLETRVILGAPKRSSGPEALQTYEITGASETPGTPEIPGVPEMLNAPEIPGAPEMLNAPEISGASEMLNAPEIPGAPAMLNAPEIPGAPRCSTVVRSQVLLRYSVLLKCSAVGSAPKFTFAHAFDEGQILILLISTIYTVLDENKGDERQLSSRFGESRYDDGQADIHKPSRGLDLDRDERLHPDVTGRNDGDAG
ncbi:hypothetical protein BDD12DRAFT_885586 [Trichophaea hybrida]|nr:hypothetical protein BDD12DRAFT_885586 [Trichophaea hybrida]